jgi:segregation and condensation protein B
MLKEEFGSQVLAILFAATEPVTLEQLRLVFPESDPGAIEERTGRLVAEFNAMQDALEIRKVAGGLRLTTRPEHHEVVRAYLKTRPSAKLSLAALETLSVIAYKQPITLPEIMEIRGIKSTTTIRTLLEKKLIQTKGRKKVVGRPIMYGTTREFLVHFGLNDLSELPTLKEFEEILGQDLLAPSRSSDEAVEEAPATGPAEDSVAGDAGEEGD